MTDTPLHVWIAQFIWQVWVAETGQSMPAGMADKMADAVVRELKMYQTASGQYITDVELTSDDIFGPERNT